MGDRGNGWCGHAGVRQCIQGSQVVKSGAWYYIGQIFAVYLSIHGVPQWKNCSLHFKSDFLVVLHTSFKAGLKTWIVLKTTEQVSFSN